MEALEAAPLPTKRIPSSDIKESVSTVTEVRNPSGTLCSQTTMEAAASPFSITLFVMPEEPNITLTRRSTRQQRKRPPPTVQPTQEPVMLPRPKIRYVIEYPWGAVKPPLQLTQQYTYESWLERLTTLSLDARLRLASFTPEHLLAAFEDIRISWLEYRRSARPLLGRSIATTLRQSPRLQALSLAAIAGNLTAATLMNAANEPCLPKLPITRLSLANCRNVGGPSVTRLLTRTPNLKDLNLHGCPGVLTSGTQRQLSTLLQSGQLKRLVIQGTSTLSTESEGLQRVAFASSGLNNSALEVLKLSRATVELVLGSPLYPPTLREMTLTHCHFDTFSETGSLPQLETLCLEHCRLPLKKLPGLLKDCPNLQRLTLRYIEPSDDEDVDSANRLMFWRDALPRVEPVERQNGDTAEEVEKEKVVALLNLELEYLSVAGDEGLTAIILILIIISYVNLRVLSIRQCDSLIGNVVSETDIVEVPESLLKIQRSLTIVFEGQTSVQVVEFGLALQALGLKGITVRHRPTFSNPKNGYQLIKPIPHPIFKLR